MTQTRSVLVLGGGIAGMSAAKTLAASGLMVHLVEKEPSLGGNAHRWACMAKDECRNCGACLSAELKTQIQQQPNLEIHLQTHLTQLKRTGKGCQATLKGQTPIDIDVDAVLLATGFTPFDPSGFQSLGYGQHAKVITTAELNDALKLNTLDQFLPDSPNPAIAFIQCVGSRNREIGRDYCSQVCCKTALRQADKLLHRLPAADISLFHLDLQIIGKEMRTLNADLAQRIQLMQGVPAEILPDRQEGKLTIIREDYASGARLAHHFDLIVLAVGMGPASGAAETMALLGLTPDDWGFASSSDPSESQGIYLAGSVRAPMDILTAQEEGRLAADRIISDLGISTAKPQIAVLGQGKEGAAVAEALAKESFEVILVAPNSNSQPASKNLQLLSNSRLTGIRGSVGDFKLDIENDQGSHTITAYAIIAANGADRSLPPDTCKGVDASKIQALDDFEALANKKTASLPAKILFWQDCFGPEWKENSRRVLRLAEKLAAEKKSVTVLMEKMLVHGLTGQRQYDRARRQGVKFLRTAPDSHPTVTTSTKEVIITVQEATLPGLALDIQCDLLVIPEKVAPRAANLDLADCLGIACDTEGFLQSANVRHRPIGSPRKGIFFVGACHDENDPQDLEREISAVKAALARLQQAPTKEEELPQIKEGHCVRCLTCFRICPHGAITLKAFRQPAIVSDACFNCGLCIANCPAEAIAPLNLSASVPEALPQTVVFACKRSGALAAGEAFRLKLCEEEHLKVVPVNCACRLNVPTLLEPLVKGSRKVMIAACHPGNCRSVEGPENTAAKVARIYSEIHLPTDRLNYRSIAANEPVTFAAMVSDHEVAKKGVVS